MSGQVTEDSTHNHRCGAHVYHGHRAKSFYITSENDPELVEIRARQRTFDGAAYRTAMGNLSYAIVILKLFDARFYRIGVLYTIMSILLFILAYLRSQRSKHDFADIHQPTPTVASAAIPAPDNDRANSAALRSAPTPSSNQCKPLGRAFKTTGWGVITIFVVVIAVEIALLILILEL